MENKIVCPKCGGELYFWIVPITDELRKVDPNTGEISKTVKRVRDGYTDQYGFQCQNENCNWVTNIVCDVPVNSSFEKWAGNHSDEIQKMIKG